MSKSLLKGILIGEIVALIFVAVEIALLGLIVALFGLTAYGSTWGHILVFIFVLASITMPFAFLAAIVLAAIFLTKNDLRKASLALCIPIPNVVVVAVYFVVIVVVLISHKLLATGS